MPPKEQPSTEGGGIKASEPIVPTTSSNTRPDDQAGANYDTTYRGKRKGLVQDPDLELSEDGASPRDSADHKVKRPKPATQEPIEQTEHTTPNPSRNSDSSDVDEEGGDTGNNSSSDTKGIDRTLPPIADVEEAFQDLLQNKAPPALVDLVNQGGFHIRIATMCSGTDAPMFALEMIKKSFAVNHPGINLLDIEHAFSVEYNSWKAAFIHRNTKTTVFSDVRDFGGEGNKAYVYNLASCNLSSY